MYSIKNIFLTDDDTDDCMLFSELLREIYPDRRPKLSIAHDGVELFNLLEETVPPPPHVIFLDINMPKKNGLDCLKDIRNNPKFKNIPVVMYSTTANNEVIDRSFQYGANYYITKSQSYAQLKKSILSILSFGVEKLSMHPAKKDFVIRA